MNLKKFINRVTANPLTWVDWLIFVLLAGLCYFSLQQGDIYHTAGSSFGYLNGHILDFYDYDMQYMGGLAYMPSTYILFAIWNIPIKLFGIVKIPTMAVPWLVLMWYKALPTLLYLASGILMFKIGQVIGLGTKKAKLMTYVFLTTPIGFFSQFIFGQYDIFTVFFVLLGTYFYFKNDNFKFLLFFGISFTFKYFPLFLFVPMLFLKEKNYFKLIKSFIIASIPLAIEIILYIKSPAFKTGVFGFGAKNYIFDASIDTSFFSASIVIIFWVVICAWAFFTKLETNQDTVKWVVFFNNIIAFLIFGLSMWHPQWLLFSVPFMVIGTMINKKIDVFLIIDIILMLLFTIFTVNFWINHVDQNLFTHGIFKNLITNRIDIGLTMRDIFIIHDNNLIYSFFSGLLLVNAIFKHPKFSSDDFKDNIDKHWNLIRARFIIGVSIFVIPAYICLFVALNSPFLLINNGSQLSGITKPMLNDCTFEQYFVATMPTTDRIQLVAGTYGHKTNFDMNICIEDVQNNKIVMQESLSCSKIVDNIPSTIKLQETKLEVGKQYKFSLTAENANSENCVSIYHTAEGTATDSMYAVIDGEKQNYNLCLNIYGKD